MDLWAVTLLDGELTAETKADRAIFSAFKKVKLNLVAHPSEALHTLQDSVITKLRDQEQSALNVISEQKVKNAQMFVEKMYVIDLLKNIIEKNEHTTTVVAKA